MVPILQGHSRRDLPVPHGSPRPLAESSGRSRSCQPGSSYRGTRLGTAASGYFYCPRLAGAYGCNLKVSWYLRRNRTPGTSDCTKRPDFDASCCFDRTCTHQRRLIWDSRIMVRRQDRPDDSNFPQDTPDRPEIVLSYAWSGRAFPGGRPTLSLLVGLGDSSAQSGGPPETWPTE